MKLYYTNKEEHIHSFLSGKGWTDEEIYKAIFDITKWTAVTCMPIEVYYERVMQKCSYEEYKEFIAITEPEYYLFLKRKHERTKYIVAIILLFLAALFPWFKLGGG